MGYDFTVDVGGLDALSKNLERTRNNVDMATKRLADEGADKIGPDDLDSACDDFRSDWEDGLEKLGEAIDEVKKGLDGARKSYAELDEKIKQQLTKTKQDTGQQNLGGQE